jgi:hypothetical protein
MTTRGAERPRRPTPLVRFAGAWRYRNNELELTTRCCGASIRCRRCALVIAWRVLIERWKPSGSLRIGPSLVTYLAMHDGF